MQISRLHIFLSILILLFITQSSIGQCQVDSAPIDLVGNASGPYTFKLYVTVVVEGDGLGGQSFQDVERALIELNDNFNPLGISFDWDCKIIYKTWGFTVPNSNALINFSHPDGIDLILFDLSEIERFDRASTQHSALYVSGPLDNYLLHEMGHVFCLAHTHHGCPGNGGIGEGDPSLDNDFNHTSTTGDKVSDTPASPAMRRLSNLEYHTSDAPDCEWDESSECASHPLSEYDIEPSIINYMSWSRSDCMSEFTPGQIQRMYNGIAQVAELQAALGTSNADCCLPRVEGQKDMSFLKNLFDELEEGGDPLDQVQYDVMNMM